MCEPTVGYSWQDTHLVVTVNSGVGVGLAWKRALLVIIGFTAGFIVMCCQYLRQQVTGREN